MTEETDNVDVRMSLAVLCIKSELSVVLDPCMFA